MLASRSATPPPRRSAASSPSTPVSTPVGGASLGQGHREGRLSAYAASVSSVATAIGVPLASALLSRRGSRFSVVRLGGISMPLLLLPSRFPQRVAHTSTIPDRRERWKVCYK